MAEDTQYTVDCCKELKEQIEEDNIFSILTNEPFKHNHKTEPTLYICSDGGHGGMVIAKYCPFCGKSITLKPITMPDILPITTKEQLVDIIRLALSEVGYPIDISRFPDGTVSEIDTESIEKWIDNTLPQYIEFIK